MNGYHYVIRKGGLGDGWWITVYYGDELIARNTRLFKKAAIRYGNRKIRQHKATEASKEVYYA